MALNATCIEYKIVYIVYFLNQYCKYYDPYYQSAYLFETHFRHWHHYTIKFWYED